MTKEIFPPVSNRPDFPGMENEIESYWKENKTFHQSIENRSSAKDFVFYDGPPFATGMPHYGHLLQGTVKDLITRYKTMRGYRVERRFGWDCHGLPIELEIEKELNLRGAPDILDYGVDRYNEKCRSTVLRYTKEWQIVTERMGRWIDFENDYKTMDRDFMESVWHAFKRMWDEGLIYEGRKVLPYSWRLSTPLSNSEASLNYMDTQDPSVTVRFELIDRSETYFLVWTTTPWTLPSNLAICAGPELDYVEVFNKQDSKTYILGKSLVDQYFEEDQYVINKEFKGSELEGLTYKPLFDYAVSEIDSSNCFQVLIDDYVSDDSGTGLVHQAPAFGEDDLRVCLASGIPVFDPVDAHGNFKEGMPLIGGINFKEADKLISRDLKDRGLMFKQQTLQHNYPFCWRTDTPLMYKAISSWFVSIEKIKQKLLKNAEEIHWVPGHIKQGRFGNWLENARDWAISRNRFWGCPLPIWRSEEGDLICVGSVQELEELCGKSVSDIHKHFVDDLEINKDGKIYRRVPEVLDCWFESGSMPYGQQHYPFKNQDKFESNYPADFICEGIDQTRCWFYYLHVIGTALFNRPAFRNVICTGLILAEDGKKLSKRHKNYTPPMEVFGVYGADAMRYFLVTSPVVNGLEVRVADSEFREIVKSVILPLWNVYSFLCSYANLDGYKPKIVGNSDQVDHVLDRYILSEYQQILKFTTEHLENYELAEATRYIQRFLPILTNWYLRRSRRRFWAEGLELDKTAAYDTLYTVLTGLCKILAPVMPFITETIYRALTGEQSVHLTDWEEVNTQLIDQTLSRRMDQVRTIVSLGHNLRARNKVKVRKPLRSIRVAGDLPSNLLEEYAELIGEELNVKQIDYVADGSTLGIPECKLNFKKLGPKFGKQMKSVAAAVKQGQWEIKNDKLLVAEEHLLDPEDFDMQYKAQEGFDCASEDGLLVSLDLNLDEELILEGHAREIIRHFQTLRKDSELHLSDRIFGKLSSTSLQILKAVEEHSVLIKNEILCVKLDSQQELLQGDSVREVSIDGHQFSIQIELTS